MRKLFFLPLLTFALACSDNTLVELELAVSPELAVAQARGGQGNVVKMVPLKMKGTWAYGATGDESPCEAFPGSVATFIEFDGTSTHMGRIIGRATNCMDFSGLPVVAILSQTLNAMSANGDLLFGQGTVDDDPPIGLVVDPGVSYMIGPVLLTGGTGRFENASGWYLLSGDYSMGPGGNYTLKGMISSVGSNK